MGRRRWQINNQPIAQDNFLANTELRIIRDCTPEHEWILESGDMLYLPPRLAHYGVALESCLTYSIGFRAPGFQDLVGGFTKFLMEETDPDVRYADPDLCSFMKTIKSRYSLEFTDWQTHGKRLYMVRHIVFVKEQGVPEELEQDGYDNCCWHVLARDSAGNPIGAGRLLNDGHIGRVAVLKPWRGQGVGRALMEKLVDMAKQQGLSEVALNAQVHALDFYQALGFEAEGDEFLEAGITHRRMRLVLKLGCANKT